ncbi:MAG: STAS domain-containing protein [Scytonematopsis contorta HA4267-MV1]|jgi:anti-anti-sigma factor|nr:STAS domain-containing protein [Scytonematopsis contorta HA4267-MV1]
MITSECQLILFKPEGRIDLQGGIALGKEMATVQPQCNQLWVINLANVDFMDSCGLVPLVKCLKAARECGCRLVLCNVQTPVRLILELTQLDSVFEIFNTYEDILCVLSDGNLAVEN